MEISTPMSRYSNYNNKVSSIAYTVFKKYIIIIFIIISIFIFLICGIIAYEQSRIYQNPNFIQKNNKLIKGNSSITDNNLIIKFSFGTIDNNKRHLNIFGNDDRILPNIQSFPERTVGMLQIPFVNETTNIVSKSQFSFCTATLISRDLILTNKHCIKYNFNDKKTGKEFWNNMIFTLGHLSDGRYLEKTKIVQLIISSKNEVIYNEFDWAILQLDLALGDYYGHMGLAITDTNYFSKNKIGNMNGYSNDLNGNPGIHYNCHSKGIVYNKNIIMHDCDATRGSSGSGFYDNEYNIIALNYAEKRYDSDNSIHKNKFSTKFANLMIPTKFFSEEINIALNWFPRPKFPLTYDNKNLRIESTASNLQTNTILFSIYYIYYIQ